MQTRPPSPVNPLPPVIAALFLVICGMELVLSLADNRIIGGAGGIGWRNAFVQNYGFNSDIFQWMLDNGVFPAEHLIRFGSYIFIHGSFTHALFAGVMLLALGKFVGEVFTSWATLALFVSSSIFGALVFGLAAPLQPWLFGAFPGIYGLIGGFTYLLWVRLGQLGAEQIRAFTLIGVLMGIQLLFALFFGTDNTWIAELAGFGFGFLISFVLSPGGWSRLRGWLQRR